MAVGLAWLPMITSSIIPICNSRTVVTYSAVVMFSDVSYYFGERNDKNVEQSCENGSKVLIKLNFPIK